MKLIFPKGFLIVLGFFLLVLPNKVLADFDCTEDYRKSCALNNLCKAQCGVGLDFKNNNWIPFGADPTPQSCSSIGYYNSYGIEREEDLNQNLYVKAIKGYNAQLISYCNNNSTISATHPGELIIYGKNGENTGYLRININGIKRYEGTLNTFPVSTGINLNGNEQIQIIGASESSSIGPGWRVFTDPDLLNQANAAGDTVLIGQTWSDSTTTSIYDSYDFNDFSLLPAIRGSISVSCSDLTVNLGVENNLDKIYLSENARLKISLISNPQNLTYKFIANSYDVSDFRFNPGCNPSSPNTTYECQVINKGNQDNPTIVKWTNTFQACNGGVCSTNCSANTSFNVFPFPGIMNTNNGDVYIGKPSLDDIDPAVLKQTRFANYYNVLNILKISTFNFAVATSHLGVHNPSAPEMLSKYNYILTRYKDNNHYENVYNRFASRIRNHYQGPNIATYNVNTTLSQTDFDRFNDPNNKIQLVDVLGNSNLTIRSGITCKSRTIFLVEGDLTMTPNFEIEGDNACLFLVKGKINLNSNNSDGKDDLIKSFLISDELITTTENQKITIMGGVISRSTSFNKNVNLNITDMINIRKNISSETINYEGARYIKHFGEILSNPFLLSIREKQYIK